MIQRGTIQRAIQREYILLEILRFATIEGVRRKVIKLITWKIVCYYIFQKSEMFYCLSYDIFAINSACILNFYFNYVRHSLPYVESYSINSNAFQYSSILFPIRLSEYSLILHLLMCLLYLTSRVVAFKRSFISHGDSE